MNNQHKSVQFYFYMQVILTGFMYLNREKTSHWKLKDINSTEQRSGGNCPLTPHEVGMFLRAMGYTKSTWIYIAAGEIYGGDKYISKLRSYFPNLVSKVVSSVSSFID